MKSEDYQILFAEAMNTLLFDALSRSTELDPETIYLECINRTIGLIETKSPLENHQVVGELKKNFREKIYKKFFE